MRRTLSTLVLSLLLPTVMFGLACQEKLPMSVDEVWEQAEGDANNLGAVIEREERKDLRDLYARFEQESQGKIPDARMWIVYAKRAQRIEDDYDKVRDKVFDDFKDRSD